MILKKKTNKEKEEVSNWEERKDRMNSNAKEMEIIEERNIGSDRREM